MRVGIEYFEGDTVLEIPLVTFEEFKEHIMAIEKVYDSEVDNFVNLLCAKYGYHRIPNAKMVQLSYVYDRDIEKFYRPVCNVKKLKLESM